MRRGPVSDVVLGGAQVLGATVTAPVLRRWYNQWGATAAEFAAAMPGDDLVAHPMLGYTRAITIRVEPAAVWPWLAQIGQGRGGLYSFDGLENLARCDIHSSDCILREHQALARGDLIRLGPPGYPCFRVADVAAPHRLVLVGADPSPPHDAATEGSPGGIATWQWQLRAGPQRGTTRLVVRQRLAYPRGLSVLWHVVEPVGFVMERQMLRGIKQRAEGHAHRHAQNVHM